MSDSAPGAAAPARAAGGARPPTDAPADAPAYSDNGEAPRTAPAAAAATAAVFPGDGEMARRCRAFDWDATPLGPVANWPDSLRTAAQLVVAAGLPTIVLWGPGLIQVYNDSYARLIRAKHPYALGRGNREVWPEVWHLNGPIYDRVFAGETVTLEDAYYPLERRGAGGGWALEDAYLTLSFSPIRDASGAVAGVLANMVETTREVERRGLEAERERLLAEAEAARAEADLARARATEANQAKSEFLATMSHELRTPLNAIGGYAELLALGIRGPVTETQRADLARIQASQRHLLGLVNEVLDLAKVDAGGVEVSRAAAPVAPAVDAALALVRPQAAAKALALSETCADASGVAYLGDEPRVRQILVNLLANAVKFTPDGGRVAVSCAVVGAPPAGAGPARATAHAGPYVALRVEDTGVGIAPDQRERIFEPFTQAGSGTNPYTRATGGTGLGLTISRRLARLMGGDLTVESTPGAGSAFTLWLPAAERRVSARRATPKVPAPGVPAPGDPAGRGAGSPATPEAGATGAGTIDLGVSDPDVSDSEARGLARIGEALLAGVVPTVRAWVAALRADPAIPTAGVPGAAGGPGPPTDADLANHAATMLADVGLALQALGEAGDDPGTLRDGTAILGVIAERHGVQRARLGWTAAAVAREFALLARVVDEAVRHAAAAGSDPVEGGPPDGPANDGAAPGLERARAVVAQLLAQAERVSLGGFRLTTPDLPAPARPASETP